MGLRVLHKDRRRQYKGRRPVFFDPAQGPAGCCCGPGGCCIINPAWPPKIGAERCGPLQCCNWGKRFVIIASGTAHRFGERRTPGVPTPERCTIDVSFNIAARFTCAGDDATGTPIFSECLSALYKYKQAGVLCLGGPQTITTLATCADLDNPDKMPTATLRQVIQGIASEIWQGRNGIESALVGWSDVGTFCAGSPKCSFSCRFDCRPGDKAGSASRTWAPSCYSGTYAAAFNVPPCVSQTTGLTNLGDGSASGQYSIFVEQACPGPCQPPDFCAAFLNAFLNGDAAADFNGDGFVDGLDYDTFMNMFPDCGDGTSGNRGGGGLATQARIMARTPGLRMKVRR